ncbi:MAG TPA: hypothetical protein DEQ43_25510 [Nocardioides bacterium]|jgi:hypothetical protein|uniref:hypothetical protein n=1 Tax=uncultured Nocardioides sp. TaxID=198441 RepID=UPI000ECB2034|nr:hypothetical protein [uncultured Nocardioides sp.]HCB07568.1 hypothetical protein [Nocardioides sp.]
MPASIVPTLSAPQRRRGGVDPAIEAAWRRDLLLLLLEHPDVWDSLHGHIRGMQAIRDDRDEMWWLLGNLAMFVAALRGHLDEDGAA